MQQFSPDGELAGRRKDQEEKPKNCQGEEVAEQFLIL